MAPAPFHTHNQLIILRRPNTTGLAGWCTMQSPGEYYSC